MPQRDVRTTDTPHKPRARGRPSLAVARRAAIIEAFMDCVRRLGLSGASVDQVAKAAGMNRSLVFHYFGDVSSLVRAAARQFIDDWASAMSRAGEGLAGAERRKALVEFGVAGRREQSLRDVVLIAELYSLSGRDEGVRSLLSQMYQDSFAAKEAELAASYPEASPDAIRAVAYTSTCLGEMQWMLSFLGVGQAREAQMRAGLEALLNTLEADAPPGPKA